MKKFIAQEVAIQLIRALSKLITQIARHDPSLAVQMKEAGSSILMNIAEGNRRVGKDRPHLFRVAAGSTGEIDAALDVAVAWGYVDEAAAAEAKAIADRELALLWGLTRPRG